MLDTTVFNDLRNASSTAQNHIAFDSKTCSTRIFKTVNIEFKLDKDTQQAERASVWRASEHRLAKRMTSTLEVVDAIINAGGSHMCWTTTR